MNLLELWLRQDLLTPAQVARAKEYGRKNAVPILDALLLLAYVTPTQLRKARESMDEDRSGCRIFDRKRRFHVTRNAAIFEE